MPLVNTENMLKKAQKNGYAVGAFNAENMETVQAIVAAAVETSSPVIIQTTPGSVRYAGLEYFYANAAAAAEKARTEVALHLDHGESYELCRDALSNKYTSVMIDGSRLPFSENAALTKKVVEEAARFGVFAEAELGTLGGKEDDLEVKKSGQNYTDPAEAYEFVKMTGVFSLAVAVGTMHGFYSAAPVLDIGRIKKIRRAVENPLVLHGASGLADTVIKECIAAGISKINFATELREAFTVAVKDALKAKPAAVDPKSYLGPAREAVTRLVKQKILLCGCAGKN